MLDIFSIDFFKLLDKSISQMDKMQHVKFMGRKAEGRMIKLKNQWRRREPKHKCKRGKVELLEEKQREGGGGRRGGGEMGREMAPKQKETVAHALKKKKKHALPRCEKCSQTPFLTSKKPQGLARVWPISMSEDEANALIHSNRESTTAGSLNGTVNRHGTANFSRTQVTRTRDQRENQIQKTIKQIDSRTFTQSFRQRCSRSSCYLAPEIPVPVHVHFAFNGTCDVEFSISEVLELATITQPKLALLKETKINCVRLANKDFSEVSELLSTATRTQNQLFAAIMFIFKEAALHFSIFIFIINRDYQQTTSKVPTFYNE
ncbi:hypothetical protein D9C73_005142 [Collichthys lucidus]|uniref:Uncharacterized protein n=1 Tax=Collichthys lucidus TaxID=240159 RepID=A0A4U5UAG7_COLLU|nr:hypothetical protein D9C73_005142 [Collichthys lucidus]